MCIFLEKLDSILDFGAIFGILFLKVFSSEKCRVWKGSFVKSNKRSMIICLRLVV